MVLQVFQLLMLLIGIPLLQSLLSGCDRKISRSISHRQYPEHLILYSQKNPFRKTNNDFCVDSAEKSKILPSKSALFSSSTGRGRKKNFIPSDGISSDSPTRRNMRDVLTLSLTGCLLSIIITRDIWCAASSFLVLNVITSQQNLFGSFLRGFSRKFVTFSRGLTRKKMITNIIDFLKAVNEASVLNEPRSNLRSQMKIMERSKGSRNYTPFVTDDNNDAANIGKIDSLLGSTRKNIKRTSRIDHNRHIQTAVTSQIKGGINRTIFAEDDSDEELLPLSTEVPSPLTGNALSGIETETVPSIEVKVQEVCVHVDDKIVGHDFPPHLPIQPASVSDNVVIATIEVSQT